MFDLHLYLGCLVKRRSLSLGDGARKDILRWVTHGPEGDIVSLYTTLPWAALCDEVAKLKIDLRAGRLLELRKAANSNSGPEGSNAGLLPPLLPPPRTNEKAPKSRRLESHFDHGGGGNRRREEGCEKFNPDATLSHTLRKLLKTSSRLVPSCPRPSHRSERAYGNLTATALSQF